LNENWFILVHVGMECLSKDQVKASNLILSGAKDQDRKTLNEGLELLSRTLDEMFRLFKLMWSRVAPSS